MFDEMTIRTAFMKGMVAKMIEKRIKKRMNKDIRINFKKLEAHTTEGEMKIDCDITIRMAPEDFEYLLNGED